MGVLTIITIMFVVSYDRKFNLPKSVRDAIDGSFESDILERSSAVTNIAYMMNPTIG